MKPMQRRAKLAKQLRRMIDEHGAGPLADAADILDGHCEWRQDENGYYNSCLGGCRVSHRTLKPTYCGDCGRLAKLVKN